MCAILGVAKTSDYRFRKPPDVIEEALQVRGLVREIFFRHSRHYGSRRLEVELKSQGVELGRHRIRRLIIKVPQEIPPQVASIAQQLV